MAFSDSNPTPSAEQVNQAHTNSDVDKSRLSQHHTLGTSATQASPGNHNHDGISSVKIKATDIDGDIPAANGLPAGGTAGQILAKETATDYDTIWIDNFTPQVKHLVKNGSGAAMTKGQVVYISGADGTNMLVSLADADMDATSATTIGLLEQDLAVNAHGYVVTEGLLAGLDTSMATAGDPVWLSSTAGGKIYGLANKPVAPVHLVYLGVVTRVQSNNGEIFISVNNGWEIDELHNVQISSVANGDLIKYDSATSLWKNAAQSTLTIAPSQVTGTAVITTDSRLSDARTPTAHASTHASGGSDQITIAPAQVTGTAVITTDSRLSDARTPTAHTHGNISNSGLVTTTTTATNPLKVLITDASNAVGLLPTTGASSSTFLRGDGTWVSPLGYVGSFQTTAASSSSAVSLAPATVSTTPASDISIIGGATTNTAGNAGEVYITGGASTTGTGLSTGGNVVITGGATNTTNGSGGNVTINGGLGSAANGNGSVNIGSTNTASVTITPTLTVTNGVSGALNLVGTSSPLQVQGSAGTSGTVLTSAGAGATPTWTAAPTAAVKVAANRTTSTTGTTALTVNTGETFAITFPSGRFSVSPAVTASTSSPRYIAAVTQVTTSGFTLSVRNVSDATGTTYLYHWNAIEIIAGMGN